MFKTLFSEDITLLQECRNLWQKADRKTKRFIVTKASAMLSGYAAAAIGMCFLIF